MTVANFKITVDGREVHVTPADHPTLVADSFGMVQRMGYLLGISTGYLAGLAEACKDDKIAKLYTTKPVAMVTLSGEFTEQDVDDVKRAMSHMLGVIKGLTDKNQAFIEIEDLSFKIYF
jgi:hypothetical protein